MRILVVEDQNEMRQAIVRRLVAGGYAVDHVADGDSAEELLATFPYAVIVLDRMLPDGDGATRLRAWRKRGETTPVLLLTALDRIADRVEGFEQGADDYLVKPFAMEELLARIAALARRREPPVASVLKHGDLEIDTARHEVRRGGVLIPLRSKEYAVLTLLASRPGRVTRRQDLLDECWDMAHEPLSNVEEAAVASLRRKLGPPPLIHTVRGVGYRFEAPGDD